MNDERMDAPMLLEGQTDPFAHIAHTKKRAFLKALASSGQHTHACRVAQIAHSNPAYWRHRDLHWSCRITLARMIIVPSCCRAGMSLAVAARVTRSLSNDAQAAVSSQR